MFFSLSTPIYNPLYFEVHSRADQAIQREKTLKHWKRGWKIALIERNNPHWADLYEGLCS